MIQKILDKGHSFILVCKTKSHKALYKTVENYKQAKSVKTFTLSKIDYHHKQHIVDFFINSIGN
jgi:hypothetical protein